MDDDMAKLTMMNKDKLAVVKCPKCYAECPSNSEECPNCGVIFKKIKPPVANDIDKTTDSRSALAADNHRNATDHAFNPKKITISLLLIALVMFGIKFVYATYIESHLDARNFESQIDILCNTEITESNENRVVEGEDPFRIGKVLVVSPAWSVTKYNVKTQEPYTMSEPSKIHPVWFKLSGKIRAKNPDEIGTLIRIRKKLGTAGRYGKMKTKVFSTHKIILDVYDWQNQTYIGTKVFDPGEGSAFMTEEDYDAMVKSVSDKAITDFIKSMEIYE